MQKKAILCPTKELFIAVNKKISENTGKRGFERKNINTIFESARSNEPDDLFCIYTDTVCSYDRQINAKERAKIISAEEYLGISLGIEGKETPIDALLKDIKTASISNSDMCWVYDRLKKIKEQDNG